MKVFEASKTAWCVEFQTPNHVDALAVMSPFQRQGPALFIQSLKSLNALLLISDDVGGILEGPRWVPS